MQGSLPQLWDHDLRLNYESHTQVTEPPDAPTQLYILSQACIRISHVIVGFCETSCLNINFKILLLFAWILVFWWIISVFGILFNSYSLISWAMFPQEAPWILQDQQTFWEGPGCHYFHFYGPQGLYCNHSTQLGSCSINVVRDMMKLNRRAMLQNKIIYKTGGQW